METVAAIALESCRFSSFDSFNSFWARYAAAWIGAMLYQPLALQNHTVNTSILGAVLNAPRHELKSPLSQAVKKYPSSLEKRFVAGMTGSSKPLDQPENGQTSSFRESEPRMDQRPSLANVQLFDRFR
jgi:hypothetical protein